jgi:hypothetical protein
MIQLPLSFGFEKFPKEFEFSNQLVTNYLSSITIFETYNNHTAMFYIDTNRFLTMQTFSFIDNKCQVFNKIPNITPTHLISQVKVLILNKKYLINISFAQNYQQIRLHCNKIISCQSTEDYSYSRYISIITDEKTMSYSNHRVFRSPFSQVAASNSNILFINSSNDYHYFDSSFQLLSERKLNNIKQNIKNKILDIAMNDQKIFFLCGNKVKNDANKLSIFDAHSFDLLKEIDTSGNQIKLFLTYNLIVFDPIDRKIELFDQQPGFNKLDELKLEKSTSNIIGEFNNGLLASGSDELNIARDETALIMLYNSKSMRQSMLGGFPCNII